VYLVIEECTAGESVTIWKHSSRQEDYRWVVPLELLKQTPSWNPSENEIPMSPRKAFRVAKAWIDQKHPGSELLGIYLKSVGPTHERLKKYFFYCFEFQVGEFDSMAVIVLLNGKVVEPRVDPAHSSPALKKKH
jgi:hypothetical protein